MLRFQRAYFKQSEKVESREILDAEFKKFADEYEGKEIPRPDWGGRNFNNS